MPRAGRTHHITIADVATPNERTGFMRPRNPRLEGQDFQTAPTISPRVWDQQQVTEAAFPIEVVLAEGQRGWAGGLGFREPDDEGTPRILADARFIDTGNAEGHPIIVPDLNDVTMDALTHGATAISRDPYPGAIAAWDRRGRAAMFVYAPTNVAAGVIDGLYLCEFDLGNLAFDADLDGSGAQKVAQTQDHGSITGYIAGLKRWRPTIRQLARTPVYYKDRGYLPIVSTEEGGDGFFPPFPYAIESAQPDEVNEWSVALFSSLGVVNPGFSHFAVSGDLLWGAGHRNWRVSEISGQEAINPESSSPSAISSSSNPSDRTSWATPVTQVGHAAGSINAMLGDHDNLLICKDEGIFRLDSSHRPFELDNSLRQFWAPGNFLHSAIVGRRAILPLAGGRCFEINLDSFVLREISLVDRLPNHPQFHGRMMPIPADPNSFFALVQEPDEAQGMFHVLKAQWIAVRGRLDWRWSHISSFNYSSGGEDADTLRWQGLTGAVWGGEGQRLLFIGMYDSAGSMPYKVINLDDAADHVSTVPSASRLTTPGPYISTVEFDGRLPNSQKRYESVDLKAKELNETNNYMEALARIDGGDWFFLSESGLQADARADADEYSLTFPPGATGLLLELQLRPYRDPEEPKSPYPVSLTVNGQLRPTARAMIPVTLLLADRQEQLNLAVDRQRVKRKLTALRRWRDEVSEVRVEIWDGPTEATALNAIIQPESWSERRLNSSVGLDAAWLVNFTLQRVADSADAVDIPQPSAVPVEGEFISFSQDGDHVTFSEDGNFVIFDD